MSTRVANSYPEVARKGQVGKAAADSIKNRSRDQLPERDRNNQSRLSIARAVSPRESPHFNLISS
jgi:hypothetical protein